MFVAVTVGAAGVALMVNVTDVLVNEEQADASALA